jgi:MFS family permease
LLGYLCDTSGARPISLLASLLFIFSYTLAAQAFSRSLPLVWFLVSFFLIGMGTSALYFSALITSAKNFARNRGLSIAVPIAAFGLSSFWESLLAGSKLFSRDVKAESGDAFYELDVVRLFYFFAIMLGAVGAVGAVGLFNMPPHLPKRVDGEEPSEEDALLPRAEASETSSVISLVPARDEINAEHRPFLKDHSTYLFGLVLLVLLGTGEMFINCVRSKFDNRWPAKLGTMLRSLQNTGDFMPSLDPSKHISILALSSTLSRLSSGFLSDYMSSPRLTQPWSRIPLFIALAALQAATLFGLAYAPVEWLKRNFQLASSAFGISYGGIFTLAPTVVSVVWGVGGFGRNWGILTFTPGTFSF